MTEAEYLALENQLAQELIASGGGSGTINIEQLRLSNPPLAAVLDEFALSKTARDDGVDTAKDLGKVLRSRDPSTGLASSLEILENELDL